MARGNTRESLMGAIRTKFQMATDTEEDGDYRDNDVFDESDLIKELRTRAETAEKLLEQERGKCKIWEERSVKAEQELHSTRAHLTHLRARVSRLALARSNPTMDGRNVELESTLARMREELLAALEKGQVHEQRRVEREKTNEASERERERREALQKARIGVLSIFKYNETSVHMLQIHNQDLEITRIRAELASKSRELSRASSSCHLYREELARQRIESTSNARHSILLAQRLSAVQSSLTARSVALKEALSALKRNKDELTGVKKSAEVAKAHAEEARRVARLEQARGRFRQRATFETTAANQSRIRSLERKNEVMSVQMQEKERRIWECERLLRIKEAKLTVVSKSMASNETPAINDTSEVEETIKRLSSHKGVEGIVIVNSEGIPIRSTIDNNLTIQYSALITQLAAKAKSVIRDLDPQNDLTFLRLRTKKHEIMVAPDKEYILISSVLDATSSDGRVASSKADVFTGHDSTQIALMEENVIVVDSFDRPIRAGTKKETHLMASIRSGLLHRAFSVFLFDTQGRLLLQQRSDEKITFPKMWTNTCCSHPLHHPAEMEEAEARGVKVAARRKLEHELGIPQSAVELDQFRYLTKIHYLAPSDGLWGEHEMDYILVLPNLDLPIDPNPNEVKSVKYVSQSELREMFERQEEMGIEFTPWFKIIVEKFLYGWWEHLDSLDQFVDMKIHRM
ncbi:isopentenyl-diphosphate delta-isomerase idi1 [Gonapodya sp. JEL0774]|nr:isopentenyl-diphosphate delta-isomerase idi1 [Gonapodya sp. JEL0774]